MLLSWICFFQVIFLRILPRDSSPLNAPPFGRISFGTFSKHLKKQIQRSINGFCILLMGGEEKNLGAINQLIMVQMFVHDFQK